MAIRLAPKTGALATSRTTPQSQVAGRLEAIQRLAVKGLTPIKLFELVDTEKRRLRQVDRGNGTLATPAATKNAVKARTAQLDLLLSKGPKNAEAQAMLKADKAEFEKWMGPSGVYLGATKTGPGSSLISLNVRANMTAAVEGIDAALKTGTLGAPLRKEYARQRSDLLAAIGSS